MALIVLTDERMRREIACCAAYEGSARAARRRMHLVFGAMVLTNGVQLLLWGLAMHLTGASAEAAKWAATLSAPAAMGVIVIHQLRRPG